MDKTQERVAQWFQGLSDGGKRAFGTYVVDDCNRPHLRIFEPLTDDGRPRLFERFEIGEMLYGEVFGRAVTLIGPRLDRQQVGMSHDQIDIRAHASTAIEADFWLSDDDLKFTSILGRMWDQDEWADWSSLTAVHYEKSIFPTEIRYTPPAAVVATVEDGVTLTLKDTTSYDPSTMTYNPKSSFQFDFDDPIGLEDLFARYLMPFEYLIISATGRRSGIRELRGTNSAWPVLQSEARRLNNKYAEISRPHSPRPGGEVDRDELLHRLSDFDLPTQLPMIYKTVLECRYTVEHAAALAHSGDGFTLGNFMGRAQMVESFDRSLHPGPAGKSSRSGPQFAARLKRLDEESGMFISTQVVKDGKRWPQKIETLRNIVAHGLPASDSIPRDIRSVQVGDWILSLLFEARLLAAFGFDHSTIATILSRRPSFNGVVGAISRSYEHLRKLVATSGQ